MSAVYILVGSVGGALAGLSFFLMGYSLAALLFAYAIGGSLSIIAVAALSVLMMSHREADNEGFLQHDS
jgi:hypothetical protein